MTVTLHIQTVDQAKAIKTIKGKVSDIDKMKVEEQKKAVRSGYDMDILPARPCYSQISRPVGDEDRHQGAQVQQDVKKLGDVLRPVHVEKLTGNGQMAGAGDGQELRHALDQAQQDGCKESMA